MTDDGGLERFVIRIPLWVAVALALAGCGSSSQSSTSTATSTTASAGGAVTVPPTSATTFAPGARPSLTRSPPSTGVRSPVESSTVHVVVSDTVGMFGPMTLVATPVSVPAGKVTFVVENFGHIDHEVVVLETGVAYDQLPITTFDGEPNRVDESASVGETGDPPVKPGQTRAFTVDKLTAGRYVLLCNIAGHYRAGLRAPFTVT